MKALGLISKLVTAPFWRLVEMKGNIFDLNHIFGQLTAFLHSNTGDATSIVQTMTGPYADELVVKDDAYNRLAQEDKYDVVVHILQLIFGAWDVYLSKAIKDHLAGGQHHVTDNPVARQKYSSTVKHNKFDEHMFGLLDHLTKHRPNASTLANESLIMLTQKKNC
ncbi:hypothetical protein ACJMK2_005740 [Sinanodonta woodiana]|uniref:Uncharacterized protein n=1 Tax=Sinanodonta woodiana TaxID=1069815 RepID=A0ABD3VU15_SINWO